MARARPGRACSLTSFPGALRSRVTGGAALLVAIVGALALTGGLRMPGGASGPPPELTMPRADLGAAGTGGAEGPTTTASELRVHAAGAVARPGVVQVAAGARVAEVIEAAGGPSAEADLDQVNLAAPVSDGERVYVPRRGEIAAAMPGAGAAKTTAAIVNLNQATQAELESLPGVGPATAQAILDYRMQRGRFRSVDDLLNVRGIGPAKLAQIRPHARV